MTHFVELHLIQNFAPSCLNRDDTNTPKDCEFGGFRRARISSQCLKRSIRLSPVFSDVLELGLGSRTKFLVRQLVDKLTAHGQDPDQSANVAASFVEAWVSALDGNKTKVLLYLGDDEIERMTGLLLEQWEDISTAAAQSVVSDDNKKGKKKKTDTPLKLLCKELKKSYQSGTKAADIALFGRMMAEHPDMKIDAACQVAHAISTHKVSMEMDFYTAVDDLQPGNETGAGMMGVTGYNSSTYYRYALIDLHQLRHNLAGDEPLVVKSVEAFFRGFVTAVPTGKQNSMAAHNLPDTILAVVRENGAPVSLANAFEKPVFSRNNQSMVQASTRALDDYWERLVRIYGERGVMVRPICSTYQDVLSNLADQAIGSFDAMVETVITHVS